MHFTLPLLLLLLMRIVKPVMVMVMVCTLRAQAFDLLSIFVRFVLIRQFPILKRVGQASSQDLPSSASVLVLTTVSASIEDTVEDDRLL